MNELFFYSKKYWHEIKAAAGTGMSLSAPDIHFDINELVNGIINNPVRSMVSLAGLVMLIHSIIKTRQEIRKNRIEIMIKEQELLEKGLHSVKENKEERA